MEARFRWRTARWSVSIARRTKVGEAWTAWHIPRTGWPANRPWPTAARGVRHMGSKKGYHLTREPLLVNPIRAVERINPRTFADARGRES